MNIKKTKADAREAKAFLYSTLAINLSAYGQNGSGGSGQTGGVNISFNYGHGVDGGTNGTAGSLGPAPGFVITTPTAGADGVAGKDGCIVATFYY